MGIASRITKRTAVIGTVSAVALAGGIAYAAWTINGSGTASASSGSAVDVSFAPGTVAGPLYPNGAAVDVHASGTNGNPFPVDFTISGGAVATTKAGCNADSVHFTASGVQHMAATSTAVDYIVGQVSMDNTADNACQGATFTITLTGTGASA
ncbi:hypothetical protein [Dactylosporangium matsuzakiense]|uniref:Uncharacterized protein n=1 Tax=Dactylosporangium matsuzakiense TaxID=53360 RepID=A0A9W6KQI4_9ACTN|nr:hypothetical protein [Dactylosporangium matsuzakiense]UWZ44858.1 hypothetical protein Dmats_47405 [Dactylosporangium matsuzakiense]GLL03669.1 hypothetical protein GCM10017581_054150 [Dactylosporangium matsuzakiense]